MIERRRFAPAVWVLIGLGAAWSLADASGFKGSLAGASGSKGNLAGASGFKESRPDGEIHGSIQAIRGIEGIDSVPLQNLETVLRVQSRTPEQPRGTARTAAALTTSESPQPEEPQETPDGRAEHTESELKGS